MKAILFFDDFLIHREDSIRRIVHSPSWLDASAYSDPISPYGMGFAGVVPAPGSGYHLYYITLTGSGTADETTSVLCVAESGDGFDWAPLPVRQAAVGEEAHVLLSGSPAPAGCCVFYDPHEHNPLARYKMTNSPILRSEHGLVTLPSTLSASPDGIRWSSSVGSRVPAPFLPHHSDTYNSLIRNPVTGRYQITLRRRWGERRVCLVESADFAAWSPPRAIIHPCSIDPPSTHFYGMPQFYYEAGGLFIGFLWTMHMPYNDVAGGPVETEYAYSYDGLMWNRTHDLSMPRREPGQFGEGSMYGIAMMERDEDTVVYAIARREEHHRVHEMINAGRTSAVLLPGLLRKNGFVGLASTRGRGEITTECLLLSSGDLSLNVKAPFGRVHVQVCDPEYRPLEGYTYEESVEIHDDVLDAPVRWRSGRDLREIVSHKRWVRLQIRLEQAELFSINAECAFTINPNAPLYPGL